MAFLYIKTVLTDMYIVQATTSLEVKHRSRVEAKKGNPFEGMYGAILFFFSFFDKRQCNNLREIASNKFLNHRFPYISL